ncbi:MAG: DMT family transporter [Patescibacteria group bacterium]
MNKKLKKKTKGSWIYWAWGEAVAGAISLLIMKKAGLKMEIIDQVIIMVLALSLFQVLISLIIAWIRGEKLFYRRRDFFWLSLFGIVIFFIDILAFVVFNLGGKMIIFSFIFSLSIIPGAVLDRFWFKKEFSKRQFIGIGVAILATYSMFNWPEIGGINAMRMLPLWIWLSIVASFFAAAIQGISFKIKDTTSPLVMNILGGSMVVMLALLILTARGNLSLLVSTDPPYPLLWMLSIVLGALVVGQWVCNITSYKYKNVFIAMKMLVVRGTFLFLAVLLGVIFLQETFGIAQLIGMILYLGAFILIKEDIWQFLYQKKEKVVL